MIKFLLRKKILRKSEIQDLRLRGLLLIADWSIPLIRTSKTDFSRKSLRVTIWISQRMITGLLRIERAVNFTRHSMPPEVSILAHVLKFSSAFA